MSQRRTGRTTCQMESAPIGAVFVWCNGRTEYPKTLARELGRDDLDIRPLSWLETHRVAGIRPFAVVVDHAALLETEAQATVKYLRARGSGCCNAIRLHAPRRRCYSPAHAHIAGQTAPAKTARGTYRWRSRPQSRRSSVSRAAGSYPAGRRCEPDRRNPLAVHPSGIPPGRQAAPPDLGKPVVRRTPASRDVVTSSARPLTGR